MSFHPRGAADRMDHDAWTSGLLAAALGEAHPVTDQVLAVRGDVERAVGSMPRSLTRTARERARSGADAIRATLRHGALELHVEVREAGGRTWVRVAHADASVLISVEPLGRSARTGLVRAIDAPPDLARSMLRGLASAWADVAALTPRSPPRENAGPDPSTSPAEGGQITMRCN